MKATYIKTSPTGVFNVSRIVTVHYYEFDKSFTFAGESHDFWEMVYVDRGQVMVSRDGEELLLSQGELIFHKPHEFHAIRAHGSAPNFFVISFVCTSAAMQSFERYRTRPEPGMTPLISGMMREAEGAYVLPRNDPALRRLVRRECAPVGAEQLVKLYLEEFLILLLRSAAEGARPAVFPSKESMENHLVTEVRHTIAERAEAPLSIGELCARLGYSKSYLCRLFREQTGDTIAATATRERIAAARRLIREGTMNFSEISDRLGFDNPQYFSRVFRRVTGMTPSEFRASLKAR